MNTWHIPRADAPLQATVRVPGSKSLTNRYLVLAAQAAGTSVIHNPLYSRDTRLMMDALRNLGVTISAENIQEITENTADTQGSLSVTGLGKATSNPILPGNPDRSAQKDAAHIDCGLAGTVMRFVPPLVATWGGAAHFAGDAQALSRPIAPLLSALRTLGATVTGTAVPFTISARPGLSGGRIDIDASASSQFLSALLLSGASWPDGLQIRHTGSSLPSVAHIEMTLANLRDYGVDVRHISTNEWHVFPGIPRARSVTVEPDLSNAATFIAAAVVTGGQVEVMHWPERTTQAGNAICDIARRCGATVELLADRLRVTGSHRVLGGDFDLGDIGELTPVVAAMLACSTEASAMTNIGHLRGHETDRLAALARELQNLGAKVEETETALYINSPVKYGGEWETYHDHRMVMAAAVVGAFIGDVHARNPGTVAKTLPNFVPLWEEMFAESSRGA